MIHNPAKFDRISTLADKTGYQVRHNAEAPSKPYSLKCDDGGHIASFATLDQLESNLRARNGC